MSPIALPILERAQVLRDSELSNVLVRRVEEHRYWKANAPAAGADELLFALVRDADEEIAAEAMELVIARSRRFDRFQEPAWARSSFPPSSSTNWSGWSPRRSATTSSSSTDVAAVDAAIEESASALDRRL